MDSAVISGENALGVNINMMSSVKSVVNLVNLVMSLLKDSKFYIKLH